MARAVWAVAAAAGNVAAATLARTAWEAAEAKEASAALVMAARAMARVVLREAVPMGVAPTEVVMAGEMAA